MNIYTLSRPARIGLSILVVAASGALFDPAWAQQQTQQQPPQPEASNGGKAVLLPPRPLPDAEDPLNREVQAQTVDGLALVITIDGASVTLDAAALARVPRRKARSERATAGDVVKATAQAGGRVLSTTVVPDTVLNASEGGGLVRTERRQISLVLEVDRAVETVAIEALATGARATLDVRGTYARICEADRSSTWCPRRGQ